MEDNKINLLALIPHGNEIAVLKKIQARLVNEKVYPIHPLFCPLVLFNTKQTIKEQKEILESMKNDFQKKKNPVQLREIERHGQWLSLAFNISFEIKKHRTEIQIADFPPLPKTISMPLVFVKKSEDSKAADKAFLKDAPINKEESDAIEDLQKNLPSEIRVFKLALLEFSWDRKWEYAFHWEELDAKWVKIKQG
ncbi:MAG TPA: hypothetical protein PK505_06630 [Treponemataceae bacterium]|jgi:hypothetical protein|nr:hypothetical protein [Treponemataceae bacterium]